MQEKQEAWIFIEIFCVMIMLGMLASVAVPHAGQMMQESKAMSREAELYNIQTAVTEMLNDSPAGKLQSVGPVADMSRVRTCDTPPLILKDYLPGKHDNSGKQGYAYGFTADGTVILMTP
jgi:type II secretory pathway pseudopilin PulG